MTVTVEFTTQLKSHGYSATLRRTLCIEILRSAYYLLGSLGAPIEQDIR